MHTYTFGMAALCAIATMLAWVTPAPATNPDAQMFASKAFIKMLKVERAPARYRDALTRCLTPAQDGYVNWIAAKACYDNL